MNLTVKICGLRDAVTLEAALDASADMVGFVFFEPSPRHISYATARTLGARVDGRARKVALTVDADDATLSRVVEALRPDVLQLHGSESPARVAAIRAHFALPVMRAIAIRTPDDLRGIATFEAVSDYLLLDAQAPAGAAAPGGNGAAFDWSLVSGLSTPRPWLLAGGLDSANVGMALRTTGARAVDVSSGVEQAPGIKDPQKIARFVTAAREAFAAHALTTVG